MVKFNKEELLILLDAIERDLDRDPIVGTAKRHDLCAKILNELYKLEKGKQPNVPKISGRIN